MNNAETKSSFPGLPDWIDLNIIVPVSATIIVVCVGILVVCVALSRRKTPPMMNPGLVFNHLDDHSSRCENTRSMTIYHYFRGVCPVLWSYEHNEKWRNGHHEKGWTSL